MAQRSFESARDAISGGDAAPRRPQFNRVMSFSAS